MLEKHQCRVVEVPDSGLLVVLLGVNHLEIESVKAVQAIIQSMDPDAVCVELCEHRVQERDLRAHAHSIRPGSRAFLRQDLAKGLRKLHAGGQHSSNGVEMEMAFLEAYRFLKPCYVVDRDIRTTEARQKDAEAMGLWPWLHRRLPRLARLVGSIRYLRMAGSDGVPESEMVRMFHTGQVQFTWLVRQEILKTARVVDGVKMVQLESAEKIIEALGKGQEITMLPMPPHLQDRLGPESNLDVFARVIRFERDVHMAREIRRIGQKSVDYAENGLNGPLVLAVMGKAHLPGVAEHLKLQMVELDQIIAGFKTATD